MNVTDEAIHDRLRDAFRDKAGIQVTAVDSKHYPDELNVIVYVDDVDYIRAVEVADNLQDEFQPVAGPSLFLIVRKSPADAVSTRIDSRVTGVHDSRVAELIRLISARSRVSSAEPNLVYVPDARASLSAVTAARHHLVFGRRGAGKSALLVEARRQVVAEGSVVAWTNVQTLRNESPQRVYLYVMLDLLRSLLGARTHVPEESGLALSLAELHEQVRLMLSLDQNDLVEAQRLVPRLQRALASYLDVEGSRAFSFIDDFYYVPRDSQPLILDMIHGSIRDTNIWLKIASIRHLTNWWQAAPPLGLQSGQDADLIDLDVTLQDPERAGRFLEGILSEYARRVGVSPLSRVFNRSALDRLVLASGAVPRDYMVLAVSAVSRALRRENAKFVGVQDINQAAGDAAGSKIQELEEDMAANVGVAERTLATLARVRAYCLDETAYTYFLIDYRDKERLPRAYARLADLMDVRLIHLIDSGVSAPHEAGSRFEAYMLDLSQFSGSRLKQRINVLDFEDGHFVARQTRSSQAPRRGSTSRELIAILRVAPALELAELDG